MLVTETNSKTNNSYSKKISVIVPIYNIATFLELALNSLLNQKYQNLDIILINDGSSDGSYEIAKRFALTDQRIRLFDRLNEGLGKSINFGLSQACGDYIAIFEPDDYLDPEIYSKMIDMAENDCVDFVKCGHFQVYESTRNQASLDFNKITEKNNNLTISDHPKILSDLPPSMWSLLIRKDFLLSHKIILNTTPGASFQDSAFNFLVFLYGEFSLLNENLYFYRQHANQSVRFTDKYKYLFSEYEFARSHLLNNTVNFQITDSLSLLNMVYVKSLFNGFRQTAPSYREFYYKKLINYIKNIEVTKSLEVYLKNSNYQLLDALFYFKKHIDDSYYLFLTRRKIMKYSFLFLFFKKERNLYNSFCKKPSVTKLVF
jgi:glycosyltransferase involved in cell wall biosynthesis